MKRFRIIGLSLLALLALGAFAASTASAVEGVLPLAKKGFTLLSQTAILETTSGSAIECTELKGSGKFTSDIEGTATFDFLGCSIANFPAFSLGDTIPTEIKTALILIPITFQICLIHSAELQFGIFVKLNESVHVDALALGDLVVLSGAVIGELPTKSGTLGELKFRGTKGKQEVAGKCIDEKGGEKVTDLKASINGGVVQSISLTLKSGLIQFEELQELMDK